MNKYELYFLSAKAPFTYGELCDALNNGEMCREADRTLQKWKKRGWLNFERVGRRVEWKLTEQGRTEAGRAPRTT